MKTQLFILIILLAFSVFHCAEPVKPTTVSALLQKIEWLASSSPYGTSCIRIMDDKIIYIDPAALTITENTPKADLIFITHSHSDHFSVGNVRQLRKETTQIVTTIECKDILETRFPDEPWNIKAIAAGEKLTVGGMDTEALQAYNDTDQPAHVKDVGVGFVFKYRGVRLYISGDTSFIPEMNALDNIDIAVFYVRKLFSMSGEDAIKAIQTFKPGYVIPVHFIDQDQPEVDYLKTNCPDGTTVMMLNRNNP
jgi:L-ascorbate metabolism protein UlaG (beta-lactamase superfamily)